MFIHQISIFISLLGDFFGDLAVLTDFNCSIESYMDANFLLGVFLSNIMRDYFKLILNHVA